MGLTSAMLVGRTALNAAQVAIQVTGNNFANASTPGYSRQIVGLSPSSDTKEGLFFTGRGVTVTGIQRQVDSALQARLWSGLSDESAASTDLQLLSQLEATLNELTDNDLSSEFTRFFDAWSELANSPDRVGARSLVINQGKTLAASIRSLRADLTTLRAQVDSQLDTAVTAANDLLQRISDINVSIVRAEAGTGVSNSLRDQRDQLISELSKQFDVTAIEQANGTIDILIGSTPVILAGQNRGIQLQKISNGAQLQVTVNVAQDGTQLNITSGTIAALLNQRGQSIDATIDSLDAVASQLIHQVNLIHSQGFGSTPITRLTSTRQVLTADVTRALNDPTNLTLSGLPFAAKNGSFLVTVKNASTGALQTVQINVDLDGLDASNAPGFADDTSVQSLTADLDAINNVTASVNPDGTISIAADTGFQIQFSEDSSGVLAVLGINTYFTGKDGSDIDVSAALAADPGLLATGKTTNGQPVDNGAALDILKLRDVSNAVLGGRSISAAWTDAAQIVGLAAAAASNHADATKLVRENLDAQRAAVSGVSVDEESVNLLNYQRAYQGAARFITVVDQLTQELLNLI